MMSPDELIDEIERNTYDAEQTMREQFAMWADSSMPDAEFRRGVADSIAAYDDAIEDL
jgi:hypothetical protein